MPELTGLGAFASGLMAGEQFQLDKQAQAQKTQLVQLSMEEGTLKLQEEHFKFDQLKKTTDAQNKAYQAALQEFAKGDPTKTPDPVAAKVDFSINYGNQLINYGMVSEGLDVLKGAEGVMENQTKLANQQAKLATQKAQHIAALVDGLPNDPRAAQAEFDTRVLAHMADGNPIDPKALQQVRARIGDPKFREALVTEAYSKKDLAEIRLKQTQTNTSMAAGALDRAKTTYVQQLTTNAKNKEASGKKVGVDYKPEDKDSIADLAHKDFPDADPATLRALSMDAAQYAHTLMTQGMTKNNAYKEAYKKYKDISFAGLTETKLRPGSSPENPLDTPENPTPETMVKNKFYHGKDKTTGEEILYRWDGQKPVPWPGGTSRGEALSDEEVEGHEPNPIADEDEVGY